ncbi:MAG TPA: hypothetical protein VHF26_00880 [Trebonia sp.]|nr:hypothetical protein [Trebonia sp.]
MARKDGRDASGDAAAREAARIAVELTEEGEFRGSGGPRDAGGPEAAGGPGPGRPGRAGRLRAVADRVASTAMSATTAARHGAGSAGRGVSSGLGWLTGQVVAMGPRLKIRDQATLRARFPGQTDDQIAQRLVHNAARAAAAVGGATGAWAALPALPAFPAEIAAETLAVVGIEVKLVAELHEVYGMAAPGGPAERARAYVGSWAARRGVYQVDGGLLLIAGSPLARQLTRRVAARVRRSTFSLAPLFTGALAGAVLNRRETRKLGLQMRDQLRQRRHTVSATVIS